MNMDKSQLQNITINSVLVSKMKNSNFLSFLLVCDKEEESGILMNELKKGQFNFKYKITNNNTYCFYLNFPTIDVTISINTGHTKDDYAGYKYVDSDLIKYIKVGYIYNGQINCSYDFVDIHDITPDISLN